MPYARKTTRLVRRHIITYDDVCDANFQVTNEWTASASGTRVWTTW